MATADVLLCFSEVFFMIILTLVFQGLYCLIIGI